MINLPKLNPITPRSTSKEDFQNFPLEVFPEEVTKYMYELQDKMGCNPNFMAAAFLCVASICIDRSKALILKDSWREWCMLWTVIIGDAGSKKSPSTNAIFAPLKKISRDKHQAHADMERAMSPDVTTPLPPVERFYVADSTIEQYIALHSQNKKGLAIIMGEIASLISNSGKYTGGRGSDIEKYLQAFSYEDLSSDRKVAKSAHLPNAHLTIFGGIQPNVLAGMMTAHLQDNGFWDRFLFVNGNGKTGYLTKDDVNYHTKRTYHEYVEGLFEAIKDSVWVDEGKDVPVDYYRMSPSAYDSWFDFNHEIEVLIGSDSDLSPRMKSAYSKMATYFGRFILMFHILDSVYKNGMLLPSTTEVETHSVEKAKRVIRYFMFQFESVSKDVSDKKEADNILVATSGMSNKEKAILLRQKDPTLSDRAIAKILGLSNVAVSKYFK